MSKTIRSYMVAVQLVIKPTIYVEVLASSQEEALKEVKSNQGEFVASNLKAFIREAKIDLNDLSASDAKLISCGRADQYHDKSSCQTCRAADLLNKSAS